ncbi:hypothetical protein [Chlorogloeopsis sp. ULAP02]|uniref:hypothetical protein n=1 Tax=Chlorogloeopsis sp. ULAP02 TaxID=3107926 RepID=UPI003136CF8C
MTTVNNFPKLWLKLRRRFFHYLDFAIQKPDWMIMFCFSRIHLIRNMVQFIYKDKTLSNYEGNSVFEDIDVNQVVDSLKAEGIYLGINLPNHVLQEVIEFSKKLVYLGDGNPQYQFYINDKEKQEKKVGKNFITGYNFNISALCPIIKKLESDPKLWLIATKYFEKKPRKIRSKIWWTFAQEKEFEERLKGFFNFHYDLEDYWCLKFMFYLTNVDVYSSPHICVKNSHKQKKLKHQLSLLRETDDSDIVNYYGLENVLNICEKAGFGFVEDPFCFHKGTFPIQRDRLILEIKFTINNYE